MTFPLHITFSGYAIIGLTILILASSVAFFLSRLPYKSEATWSILAFYILVALSGATMILSNAFFFWDRLFSPWQDFWILAGGIALARFAYSVPTYEDSREARIVQGVLGGVTLLALAYCIYFDYLFIFQWTPDRDVADAYYLLLPATTLLVVIVFLRRSVQFSAAEEQAGSANGPRAAIRRLIRPHGDEAQAMRNLALALSLAFLPALQTLVGFSGPAGIILSNIGSILAISAIALVYFNHAPEVNSFLAKLVGITLATVLLILAIFGTLDLYAAAAQASTNRLLITAAVRDALVEVGQVPSSPLYVTYVVSWTADNPQDASAYRLLYHAAEDSRFDFDTLIAENQEGRLASWSQELGAPLPQFANEAWRQILRAPLGSNELDFVGYLFERDGVTYEIGFSNLAINDALSKIVAKWMLMILISSAVVLLGFPLFFRRTLVRPIDNLLKGIEQVDKGNLNTYVPILFHDEIGSLTQSFNRLTQSLKLSRLQQEALFGRLQTSYEELEERVSDRTRELSAFTDLTMLAGDYEDMSDLLQPALNRIMEVGLCQALCVHLLAEDGQSLALVAQRNLPETAMMRLDDVPIAAPFAGRLRQVDDPLLAGEGIGRSELPPAFAITHYPNYLGSPIVAGSQSLGWLSCYRRDGDDFQMGEISLLVALARQMGIIVENQRLRQRIRTVATYEERRRLARDLHDSITQLVFSMTLFTRSSQDALQDGDLDRLADNLAHMATTSTQALREMRSMLFELHPPALEREGFAGALNARFDMVERRVGIQVHAEVDESSLDSKEVERELYYVAIEALNNSLKHAGADQVNLTVRRDNGSILLCVRDNGRGFDPQQVSSGLGMDTMRQRIEGMGGHLQVDSMTMKGTRITATIPSGR